VLTRSGATLQRSASKLRGALACALGALLLTSCATVVDGTPVALVAPDANLAVAGDSHGEFDTTVKNALSDIFTFWKTNYPKVSGGKSLPALTGGLFSVDGGAVFQSGQLDGAANDNQCLAHDPTGIIDNAFYCDVDDSIAWDRSEDHLLGAIAAHAGSAGNLFIAMAFAHEFGHAIQHRLGIDKRQDIATIQTESQADCAAGAFTAWVLDGQAPHFRATAQQLDAALNAYVLVRDKTPLSSANVSHGNGFDRLSAVNDGINHGATYCYASSYFNRQFTERPFVTDADYLSGGNETLAQVLNANDPKTDNTAGGLQPDLNRFWSAAATKVKEPFQAVKIAQAAHPKCGATATSQFGYCPDDNTVYYSTAFADQAYNSLDAKEIDTHTAVVTVLTHQPADYALGTLFAMGWGMSVRHQLFNRGIDDKAALLAAACYAGAYSKDINIPQGSSKTQTFVLSPPDMDEATSAMMNLAGLDQAFGARGTTGLQRVQAFVKGYNGGLSAC
jgi:predicted metalloprotease